MSHKSKKRKRHGETEQHVAETVDTSKPTATYKPQQGRLWTVSVALPGSIIANAPTHDLKTALVGRIARALAVFSVDEIVIFDDGTPPPRNERQSDFDRRQQAAEDAKSGYSAFSDPGHFLYHILSYLETPPNLRKSLFPYHPNLRTAGALPSLDMPHHLKREEYCEFREGVTVGPANASRHVSLDDSNGNQAATLVDCGYAEPVEVPQEIPENTRVTLQFPPGGVNPGLQRIKAEVVSPDAPREEAGYFWGYNVRVASSLSAVFTEAPHANGYDYTIGTSERGVPLNALRSAKVTQDSRTNGSSKLDVQVPQWRHLLLAFGGLAGLEMAVKNDGDLNARGVAEASELFDAWVNLVDNQGSKTIRTEEALLIGLMGLQNLIQANSQL